MKLLAPITCLLSVIAFAAPPKELPLDESWSEIPADADTGNVTLVPEPAPKQKPLTPAQQDQKQKNPPPMGLSAPPVGVVSLPPSVANPPVTVKAPVIEHKPEDWNDVSLFGAKTLKVGSWAVGGYAGFPTFNVQARYGLAEKFDLGVAFESFYGMMNEAQIRTRYQFIGGTGLELAGVLDGSFAQFVLKPQSDQYGARWITGRRNWNVAPGIVLSRRASSPLMPRLFLDARVLIAFDTQPFQRNPLGGVPPGVQVGWNVPVRMGAEIPISPSSSFVVDLGFDVHGRPGDSVFMPVLSVGAAVGF